MLLTYALTVHVKQTPKDVRVRARRCLQLLVSLAPSGCRMHVPILLDDEWHNVVVTVDKDRIVTAPRTWHQFVQRELGLTEGDGLSVVFTRLVDPGAIMYRRTGFF